MNNRVLQIKQSPPVQFIFRHKKPLIIVLKLIFSAWLILYLSRRINLTETINIFRTGNLFLITLSAMLLPLNLYFQYGKWRVLTMKCLSPASPWDVVSSILQGIAAGILTPLRAGEYVGRKLAFPKSSLLEVTVITVIDKLFSIFAIYSTGVFAALAYAAYKLGISWIWLFIYTILIVVFIAVLLTKKNLRGSVKSFSGRLPFQSLESRLKFLGKLDRQTAVKSQLFTYGAFYTYLLQFALLLAAFDASCPIAAAFWISCLTYFAKTIVPAITVIDIGVRELTAMFFAAQFGYSESAGFNAALSVFIINLIIPALAGMILLFRNSKSENAL